MLYTFREAGYEESGTLQAVMTAEVWASVHVHACVHACVWTSWERAPVRPRQNL